eukprot:TRINITY_DN11767_c0_g1_i1.p1 TRINITY_DN11767_c0_g1~~TRINITY_DN11767_c0_g1_i1.p1  ORF type:complete len:380 (+),score=98.83 TRINITY_DN11767_c0_g1_i1:76-1215(+)
MQAKQQDPAPKQTPLNDLKDLEVPVEQVPPVENEKTVPVTTDNAAWIGEKLTTGWNSFSTSVVQAFDTVKEKGTILVQKQLPELGQKIGSQSNKVAETTKKSVGEFITTTKTEFPKKFNSIIDTVKKGANQKISAVKALISQDRLLFGSKISDVCGDYPLPFFLIQCISKIEEDGLNESDLWSQVPDVEPLIVDLRKKLDSGEKVDLSTYDVHVVASLFLVYLKSLPEPLIVPNLPALKDLEQHDRIRAAYGVINLPEVPKENRLALKKVVSLLRQYYDRHEINNVKLEDLINLFGPVMISNFGDENSRIFVSILISEWESLFIDTEEVSSGNQTIILDSSGSANLDSAEFANLESSESPNLDSSGSANLGSPETKLTK